MTYRPSVKIIKSECDAKVTPATAEVEVEDYNEDDRLTVFIRVGGKRSASGYWIHDYTEYFGTCIYFRGNLETFDATISRRPMYFPEQVVDAMERAFQRAQQALDDEKWERE